MRPLARDQPRLLQQLPLRGFQRRQRRITPALGDLPAIRVQDKPVLPHQPDISLFIKRQYPDRQVLIMDLAINALAPAGIKDIILGHADPLVIINKALSQDRPRVMVLVDHTIIKTATGGLAKNKKPPIREAFIKKGCYFNPNAFFTLGT